MKSDSLILEAGSGRCVGLINLWIAGFHEVYGVEIGAHLTKDTKDNYKLMVEEGNPFGDTLKALMPSSAQLNERLESESVDIVTAP